MVDELGTTNYTYDDAGRLKTQAGTFTGKTLTTAYVAGTSRRQSLSDGTQTWTYNYDAGLRPSSLNQTVGSATPVTYNAYYPNGAVQTRTFGNGIKTTFGYDSRGRTKSIVDKDTAGNVLEGQSYAFGPDGNLQTYGHGAWTTAYVHDGADRLTRETRTGGYGANYDCQYAFDGNGNRTSVTRNGNVYPYSPALPNDQFDRGESWVLAGYDADGNPFAADDQYAANGSYAYYFDFDEGNRLRIASGRVSGSYGYDGDGRRVVRSDSQGTSRFVYDGDQVVEVLNASNAVVEYRTPGVGFVRNGAQRYELDSALGSNLDTRDQSGANTGLTEYDAYGREVYQDVFVDRGDFRFAGAHGYANDDATGWQQLGARLYVPGIGRFLTQDPLGQAGGLNLYAYCDNSPLTRTDASGLDYWHDVGQVFLGYGDAINPLNWGRGLIGAGQDLYGHTVDNWSGGYGIMSFQMAQAQTGGDMAMGLWSTLTDWSTPRAFGRSWMTGSMIVGGEAAGFASTPISYAARVATRAADDPFAHAFPYSFDSTIMKYGERVNKGNGYVEFQIEGQIRGGPRNKTYNGKYELGGRFGRTGRFTVEHRFFRPNR